MAQSQHYEAVTLISVIARNDVRDYPEPVPTVGENIRRLRKRADLSQGDLAERIGVSQSVLSSWETDRYDLPETASLMKLAKALDCSIDDLLAGVDAVYDQVIGRRAPFLVREGHDVEMLDQDVSRRRRLADIPIVGPAEASRNGIVGWQEDGMIIGDVEEWISRPWDVDDPRAYGLRVRNDSMEPRYFQGEVIIAAPTASLRSGDFACVQLKSGERLLKQVYRQESPDTRVRGWNLVSTNTAYVPRFVHEEDVVAIHKIVHNSHRAVGYPQPRR
jgi:phage repressor protein C with HTH and peptisase S24 domain